MPYVNRPFGSLQYPFKYSPYSQNVDLGVATPPPPPPEEGNWIDNNNNFYVDNNGNFYLLAPATVFNFWIDNNSNQYVTNSNDNYIFKVSNLPYFITQDFDFIVTQTGDPIIF